MRQIKDALVGTTNMRNSFPPILTYIARTYASSGTSVLDSIPPPFRLWRTCVPKRISGHVTDSIFDRYDIGDETDLADAAERLQARKHGN
jgi:hypothetical protein